MTGRNKSAAKEEGRSGFTLIEIVVALGIFSTMILIMVSSYTQFVRQQSRSIVEQELQEDLRLILEVFSREARGAKGETYQHTLVDGQPAVSFLNQASECTIYGLTTTGTIVRGQSDRCDLPHYSSDDTSFIPLTAETSRVKITEFAAQLSPAEITEGELTKQGIISLALKVEAQDRVEPVRVQTTVISRQIELRESN